jgi:ribosome modulation factor
MIALTMQDEGAAAAAKGRSINWCPYDEGDPRRDQWMKGWRAEMDRGRPFGLSYSSPSLRTKRQ